MTETNYRLVTQNDAGSGWETLKVDTDREALESIAERLSEDYQDRTFEVFIAPEHSVEHLRNVIEAIEEDRAADEVEHLDEPIPVPRPEPEADEEVTDISSLPPEAKYPRSYVQNMILTSANLSIEERSAIVGFLNERGIDGVLFSLQEIATLSEAPTIETLTDLYGELMAPPAEEREDDADN